MLCDIYLSLIMLTALHNSSTCWLHFVALVHELYHTLVPASFFTLHLIHCIRSPSPSPFPLSHFLPLYRLTLRGHSFKKCEDQRIGVSRADGNSQRCGRLCIRMAGVEGQMSGSHQHLWWVGLALFCLTFSLATKLWGISFQLDGILVIVKVTLCVCVCVCIGYFSVHKFVFLYVWVVVSVTLLACLSFYNNWNKMFRNRGIIITSKH